MIDPLNYVVYNDVTLGDVLFAALVIAVAALVGKAIAVNLRRTLADRISRDQLELLAKLVQYAIVVVAVVAVLPVLGVNLTGLLVAGGIAGIVLGFASQSVVANLVSGLFLLWEKPIKIGDQVNVDGVMGFVEDVRIMSTIIRTYDGLYVRIPNEKIFTSNITNYVANVARRFEYIVSISYKDDAEKAVEVINRVIDEHPFALKIPEPQVFVDNLGDSGVNIVVRIWSPSTEWYPVKMELLWKIKKALEDAGIEIPFPQRVVWFANRLEVGRDEEN
ncbi:MAG: mechanosensitive ion channel family protein [Archaeoglobaceae archaeon]